MADPEYPAPKPPAQPADGTWEVRDVSEEARAAAQDAAALSGVTVGVWLDSVVEKAATQEMDAVSIEDIVDALDALGDRIAQTEATTRQSIAPLHNRLEALSQQLVKLEQMAELANSLEASENGSDDANEETPSSEAPEITRS